MALINQAQLKKLTFKATDLFNRAIDQQVTLAVTGLSQSGKTAFITSLVNQLLNEGNASQLSFFNPVHEGRFIAAKRVPQQHFHIGRFDYDNAASAFTQQPPVWPEPTKGISELRLAIRYQPKASLLKYASEMATLYVNITDYPGEWLLDLPMLNQTYEEWSEQMTLLLNQAPRQAVAQPFIDKISALDPMQAVNEELLTALAEQYTQLLHHFRREQGLSVIQPGRFILPGELKGAPILQFFPYVNFAKLDANIYQNAGESTLIGMLRARFIEYKERVVRKFYKEHFMRFDRQIVLADCLTPLNSGAESFTDLQFAIGLILESFNYGKSSLLRRLFAPKIDRLMFAATKADHITPDQHNNLVSLLNQLVYQTKQHLSFDNVNMKTLAIASVKTTQAGKSIHQGQEVPVIQGRRMADDKIITVFPGMVPAKLPGAQYWQESGFNFINFAPQQALGAQQALPHLRMDQVLQFLLGDKMK